MYKRFVWISVLFVLLFSVIGCGPKPASTPAENEPMVFSIATAGSGGIWYPLGAAISGIVNTNIPGMETTAEVTGGAVDNMKLLTAGEAKMAFALNHYCIQANQGKMSALQGEYPVRAILGLFEQPMQIITMEGSGITSLEDLRGKRVSTGAPNSGIEEVTGYFLTAIGLDWNVDLTREKLGAAESVAAMKDGKIDAFFWVGGLSTSAIVDLAATPGVKLVFLPVPDELADKVIAANPGVFHKTVIPSGAYNVLDHDVATIANTSAVFVLDSFPEERVYQILKAIFEHKEDLVAVSRDVVDLTPQKSIELMGADQIPYLHPGAVRFYKEEGALK